MPPLLDDSEDDPAILPHEAASQLPIRADLAPVLGEYLSALELGDVLALFELRQRVQEICDPKKIEGAEEAFRKGFKLLFSRSLHAEAQALWHFNGMDYDISAEVLKEMKHILEKLDPKAEDISPGSNLAKFRSLSELFSNVDFRRMDDYEVRFRAVFKELLKAAKIREAVFFRNRFMAGLHLEEDADTSSRHLESKGFVLVPSTVSTMARIFRIMNLLKLGNIEEAVALKQQIEENLGQFTPSRVFHMKNAFSATYLPDYEPTVRAALADAIEKGHQHHVDMLMKAFGGEREMDLNAVLKNGPRPFNPEGDH